MPTVTRVALAGSLALLAILACGGDQPGDQSAVPKRSEPATPEEELIDRIAEVIALAEADSIAEIFERFTPPEDLRRLKENNYLATAIERFAVFRYHFVMAMREAQTIQPEFNDDTTRAVYEIIEVEVPGHKVVFRKIEDRWYFSD